MRSGLTEKNAERELPQKKAKDLKTISPIKETSAPACWLGQIEGLVKFAESVITNLSPC